MSSRDAHDPHFLHAAKALEPMLAIPAEAPRAVSWLPGKEVLLLAQRDGVVRAVEPSFGGRVLFHGPPDPVHVASTTTHVAVLTATGQVQLREGQEVRLELDTGLGGANGLRFWRGGVAVIGDDARGGRRVHVYRGAEKELDRALPAGTTLGAKDGELLLARSVEAAMKVVPLDGALPEGEPTNHQLRFAHGARVVGVVEGGVTVWVQGQPRTVRLLDSVCGALAHDGRTLALGTRGGVVAISDVLGPPPTRGHPWRLEAHDGPVSAMSFSTRGRWLATVGENCRLWAY